MAWRHSGVLKTTFAIPGILLALIAPLGAVTAYEALQLLRTTRGDTVMASLAEVRGESGQPQPQAWTIIMNDPTARGGIREFVVNSREILSERTPLRGAAAGGTATPIDFARLNLDSDGAFSVTERQAVAKELGFNSVGYTLQTDASSGAPVWELRLSDYMGAPVGSIRISAENAKTLSSLRVDPDARQQPVIRGNPEPAAPGANPAPSASASSEAGTDREPLGGVLGAISQTARGVSGVVRDTTVNTAGTVEEWLTGRRTIGTDDDSEEPPSGR